MLSAVRARAVNQVARRGFSTSRAQMSSPYHYPEGAGTNLPFNPRSKWVGPGIIIYGILGFGAPFGIAVWQTHLKG